jgi:hypothetical protein
MRILHQEALDDWDDERSMQVRWKFFSIVDGATSNGWCVARQVERPLQAVGNDD